MLGGALEHLGAKCSWWGTGAPPSPAGGGRGEGFFNVLGGSGYMGVGRGRESFSCERNKLQKGVRKKKKQKKKKKAKCAGFLAARGPTFQETFMVHVDRPGEKEKKEWE